MYTGLPLNDSEWKYGGDPMLVLGTVMNGSPDKTKGMPAWSGTLGPSKVAKVVAFVMSHHDKPASDDVPALPEEN